MPNAYELLGVDAEADHDAIRDAYRRLVRKAHPDRHPDDPGAHERFLAIQAAYEVLIDPAKRQAHDDNPDGVLHDELLERRKAQLKRRRARVRRLFD